MTIGKTAKATTLVSHTNTAVTVGSGSLPVFSTPSMIALMEQAACNALTNHLTEGQTSVGTAINIEHLAPSPLGVEITATAEITGVEGRLVNFNIRAFEGISGKQIGKGTHARAVVNIDKFMSKLGG
ncbi:MAG: thioesterase family protein [Defluviitaleaceae bacterium]|nr:thioesterase family protein [Defluviitaleaceae bacterium]